jgi:hypothetical protein
MTVGHGRAVVFDYGDVSVKSIRIGGKLEWSFGRKGRGPGEFSNPTSMVLDTAGQTIVLDPDIARVTVISRDGKLVRTIRLGKRFDQLATSSSGTSLVGVSVHLDTLTALIDSNGVARPVTSLPPELAAAPPIAREILGVVPTPKGFLVAFRWSSTFMEFTHDGSFIRSCTGVDSLTFPPTRAAPMKMKLPRGGKQKLTDVRIRRVDPSGVESGAYLTTFGGNPAVLRHSPDSESGSVLDVYAPGCGSYRRSIPFPFATSVVAGSADSLVALLNEPVPHVVLLRWTRRSP